MKKKEIIYVDFNSLESIKRAERKKWRLENAGYNLKGDRIVGYDKIEMEYEK